MTLVQFWDNTNRNIPRDQPNSGLINQGNAQVSLEKILQQYIKQNMMKNMIAHQKLGLL